MGSKYTLRYYNVSNGKSFANGRSDPRMGNQITRCCASDRNSFNSTVFRNNEFVTQGYVFLKRNFFSRLR